MNKDLLNNNDSMNFFRLQIYDLMASTDMSQREVAISLNCTESELSKFLNGKRPFPKKKIMNIFEVCEIDIGEEL